MRAGKLRDTVIFRRNTPVPDGRGGAEDKWGDLFETCCELQMSKGRERVAAGMISALASGVLHVRYCSQAASLSEKDIAVIDSEIYNIRSIIDPDRRKRRLELVVERGVAV
ncbi:Phage head-tail joining protein [Pseudovibrio sp. Ad46]|uniref:phage head closure protein n=1 Tax=Pseudovibrio sp. Ad46 TaxID=989432 RepID=UPI0007AEE337|nr:phage head closure protein [Pseudovibrio sp. Ad46]KZK80066.1 Phage head-tail joining protein [Pseudovibrio sp. Ad46]